MTETPVKRGRAYTWPWSPQLIHQRHAFLWKGFALQTTTSPVVITPRQSKMPIFTVK